MEDTLCSNSESDGRIHSLKTERNEEDNVEHDSKRMKTEEKSLVKDSQDIKNIDQDLKEKIDWTISSNEEAISITSDLLTTVTPSASDDVDISDAVGANKKVASEIDSVPIEERSRCLHVINFVRPLTKMELDDLLSQAGSLVEDQDIRFWMDKKRSHCYCTYKTVNMAVTAFGLFDGLKFPPGNPKVLRASFVPEDQIKGLIAKAIESEGTQSDTRRRPSNNNNLGSRPERSSASVKQAQPVKVVESTDPIKTVKPIKTTEPTKPADKTLDQLFKKTKTEPFIYWLPLTDDQIKG